MHVIHEFTHYIYILSMLTFMIFSKQAKLYFQDSARLYLLKDVHHRQKLTTDFVQNFWIDYLNFEKKNIYILTMVSGWSFFKGLDNKNDQFGTSLIVLTTDFFSQFEIHIGLHTRFKFTKYKKPHHSAPPPPPPPPEQDMFKKRWAFELFYSCARSRIARF